MIFKISSLWKFRQYTHIHRSQPSYDPILPQYSIHTHIFVHGTLIFVKDFD
jgi:hypothetical protein